MSISFEVFGKDKVYNCEYKVSYLTGDQILDIVTLKVEDPFFGERKLFIRKEGFWKRLCVSEIDQITDDSFKCFNPYGDLSHLEGILDSLDSYIDKSKNQSDYPNKQDGEYTEYFIFDEVTLSYVIGNNDYTCTKSE